MGAFLEFAPPHPAKFLRRPWSRLPDFRKKENAETLNTMVHRKIFTWSHLGPPACHLMGSTALCGIFFLSIS